jgi:LPPG:FO 2-phospho-L-lactate transferase
MMENWKTRGGEQPSSPTHQPSSHPATQPSNLNVVALAGGVGGAKLAWGLAQILPPERLTLIVNTADDFEHLGLHVSPDLDTVMYTLAGLANPDTGWGLAGDTFRAMETVAAYGGPEWFNLGDRDLGTSLVRTALLREGHPLSAVTGQLCRALGIQHPILPMSDDPVHTWLDTDQGPLPFQVYFVRERWQPVVRRIRFEGAESARSGAGVSAALEAATLIVYGPSNPFLSIDPILSVPGIRECVDAAHAPRIAVSPIVGGQALKGPAAKLMAELGVDVSPMGIVTHFQDRLDGIILDHTDANLRESIERIHIRATTRQTVMTSLADKTHLAEELLNWVEVM